MSWLAHGFLLLVSDTDGSKKERKREKKNEEGEETYSSPVIEQHQKPIHVNQSNCEKMRAVKEDGRENSTKRRESLKQNLLITTSVGFDRVTKRVLCCTREGEVGD